MGDGHDDRLVYGWYSTIYIYLNNNKYSIIIYFY